MAASAVLLTLGALWMRDAVYEQRMSATYTQAEDELERVMSLVSQGTVMTGAWGELPYEVVASGSDAYFGSSPDLQPYEQRGPVFPQPEFGGGNGLIGARRTVSVPELPADGADSDPQAAQLANRVFPAVSGDLRAGDSRPEPPNTLAGDLPDDAVLRVYVVITPFQAEASRAAVDRVLLPAVPLGSLLVGAVAYMATRSALRSVEAIRLRTASVSAFDPRERVDVPDTSDEINALAVTVNATLQRLEDASASQRRFVADAAHELRSPLASLITALEVALAYPDRADWTAVTTRAAAQAHRLRVLADDLLLLARLDGQSALPSLTPVDVGAIAGQLVDDFAVMTDGSPTVTCVVAEGELRALAARGPLERILRNLLDNAVKYAERHIEVAVRSQPDDTVVVEVRDDGPGIPPQDRARIFERFTRLDEARHHRQGGAGLGLAIARDLATRQRGNLFVADHTPGTLLVLVLPSAPRHGTGQA
ncbi:sensor histidine kinase [Streptomyces sp. NPDC004082]